MRSGELVMVKFVDMKATGDKEIYVADSKGTANTVPVEGFKKAGVDLSNSSFHHACMERKSHRWLLSNAFVIYRAHDSKARFSTFLSYFVRETMESTGICRKPLTESTAPQQRTNSFPNDVIPQKLAKVQQCPSELYV